LAASDHLEIRVLVGLLRILKSTIKWIWRCIFWSPDNLWGGPTARGPLVVEEFKDGHQGKSMINDQMARIRSKYIGLFGLALNDACQR